MDLLEARPLLDLGTPLDLLYGRDASQLADGIASGLGQSISTAALIKQVLDMLQDLLEAGMGGVLLYEPGASVLALQKPAYGVSDDNLISAYRLPINRQAAAVQVFLTGKPYLCNAPQHDPNLAQEFVELFGVRNFIDVPLVVNAKPIGVLQVVNKRRGDFRPRDVRLLMLLSSHLAALIEKTILVDRERAQAVSMARLYELVEKQHQALQRSEAIHRQFTQMVLDGRGLDAIATTLAQLVANPVVVQDRFFHTIVCTDATAAFSDEPAAKSTWDIALSPEDLCDSAIAPIVESLQRERRPAKVARRTKEGRTFFLHCAPSVVGEQILGYISIVALDQQLSDLDRVALEHAATVVALELMKQKTAFEVESRLRGDFLHQLLLGSDEAESLVLQRGAFLGFDFSHRRRLFLVSPDAPIQEPQLSLDAPKLESVRREVLTIVTSLASRNWRGSISGATLDGVVLAVPDDVDPDPRELASLVRRRLAIRYPRCTISVVQGAVCNAPREYKRAFGHARDYLHLLRTVGKTDQVVSMEEVDLACLALAGRTTEELARFVEQSIGRLLAYDRQHRASLVDTLEHYLRHDGHLERTASACFVHLNTLRLRLERIQQVSGLDLRGLEARFQLWLGLRAYRLMQRR